MLRGAFKEYAEKFSKSFILASMSSNLYHQKDWLLSIFVHAITDLNAAISNLPLLRQRQRRQCGANLVIFYKGNMIK